MKLYDGKSKIPILKTKEVLKWVVEADTTSSQKVAGVLKTMMHGRSRQLSIHLGTHGFFAVSRE